MAEVGSSSFKQKRKNIKNKKGAEQPAGERKYHNIDINRLCKAFEAQFFKHFEASAIRTHSGQIMEYQSDMPISSLTGKQRFESIRKKTFEEVRDLQRLFRFWLFVGIFLAILFLTNLLIILATDNSVLILQLNVFIIGNKDIADEDKVPQILLVLPLIVLLILALVPYVAGRMLSQSMTVKFCQQIVSWLLYNVGGFILVSVSSMFLDFVYFMNIDPDDQTYLVYVITGGTHLFVCGGIAYLGYYSYKQAAKT